MITSSKWSLIIFKLCICLITIILWIIYRLNRNSDDEPDLNYEYCFNDILLTEYLYPITKSISQHLYLRDILLISGSNILDVLMLYFIAIYVKIGNSWSSIMAILVFYANRGFIQNIISFNYYHTYLFLEAPFPSIFVPVFRATDFFFSGHCGITLIAALQFRDWGYKRIFLFGLIVSFWEGVVMTVLRAHYSIDIIFGWIVSHNCYWWSNYLGDLLDKKFNIFGKPIEKQNYIAFKSAHSIGEIIKENEKKNKSSFDNTL